MEITELNKILESRTLNRLNEFSIPISSMRCAIVFSFSNWSPTIVQLRTLNKSLANFNFIYLYVFNIDDIRFGEYAMKNEIRSDGWGETFWIKDGKIIASDKKYTSANLADIINRNNQVSLSS